MAYQDRFYTIGDVTVENGSAVVTGTGTGWETALIDGGVIFVGGGSYPIYSVESETSLTLAYPFTDVSDADLPYAIDRQRAAATSNIQMNDRLAQIIREISIGNIEELNALTLLPDKSLSTDAQGKLQLSNLGQLGRALLALAFGTSGQIVQADGAIIDKSTLPISTATQTALNSKIISDTCSYAGFVGGDGNFPYFRHTPTGEVVKVSKLYRDSATGYEYAMTGAGRVGMSSGNGAEFHWNAGFYYRIDNTSYQLINSSPSDERLKENIEDIPDALELVKKFRPVKYTYKDGLPIQTPSGNMFGLIAQDLQRIQSTLVAEAGMPRLQRQIDKEIEREVLRPVEVVKTDENGNDYIEIEFVTETVTATISETVFDELPEGIPETYLRFAEGADKQMIAILFGAVQALAARIETLEGQL